MIFATLQPASAAVLSITPDTHSPQILPAMAWQKKGPEICVQGHETSIPILKVMLDR
jgi:hypothetical protein